MSHGTAINNTLRQLTGAIGAATMISIMTNATKKATYLSAVNAQIYGINKAFFSSGIVLIITIVIAIIFVGKNDKKKNNNIKNIEEIVVEEEIA